MYIEAIKFKREENSEWENGYYIGKYENCDESVILDSKYKPLERDEKGCRVWDYRTNLDNWINLRIPEKEEIEIETQKVKQQFSNSKSSKALKDWDEAVRQGISKL